MMALYAMDSNGHALPAEIRLVRISPTMPVAPPVEALSARECEVLTLIAAGIGYDAAARHLCISERTFRSHAHNINAKLATHNVVQSVVYGMAAGLVMWRDIEALWRQHAPYLLEKSEGQWRY